MKIDYTKKYCYSSSNCNNTKCARNFTLKMYQQSIQDGKGNQTQYKDFKKDCTEFVQINCIEENLHA